VRGEGGRGGGGEGSHRYARPGSFSVLPECVKGGVGGGGVLFAQSWRGVGVVVGGANVGTGQIVKGLWGGRAMWTGLQPQLKRVIGGVGSGGRGWGLRGGCVRMLLSIGKRRV
jgi:hypothetical protein